jgi:hypothetical protein
VNEINAADRHKVGPHLSNRMEKFEPVVLTARAGDAAVSKYEDTAEVQFSPHFSQERRLVTDRSTKTLGGAAEWRASSPNRRRSGLCCAVRTRAAVTLAKLT